MSNCQQVHLSPLVFKSFWSCGRISAWLTFSRVIRTWPIQCIFISGSSNITHSNFLYKQIMISFKMEMKSRIVEPTSIPPGTFLCSQSKPPHGLLESFLCQARGTASPHRKAILSSLDEFYDRYRHPTECSPLCTGRVPSPSRPRSKSNLSLPAVRTHRWSPEHFCPW